MASTIHGWSDLGHDEVSSSSQEDEEWKHGHSLKRDRNIAPHTTELRGLARIEADLASTSSSSDSAIADDLYNRAPDWESESTRSDTSANARPPPAHNMFFAAKHMKQGWRGYHHRKYLRDEKKAAGLLKRQWQGHLDVLDADQEATGWEVRAKAARERTAPPAATRQVDAVHEKAQAQIKVRNMNRAKSERQEKRPRAASQSERPGEPRAPHRAMRLQSKQTMRRILAAKHLAPRRVPKRKVSISRFRKTTARKDFVQKNGGRHRIEIESSSKLPRRPSTRATKRLFMSGSSRYRAAGSFAEHLCGHDAVEVQQEEEQQSSPAVEDEESPLSFKQGFDMLKAFQGADKGAQLSTRTLAAMKASHAQHDAAAEIINAAAVHTRAPTKPKLTTSSVETAVFTAVHATEAMQLLKMRRELSQKGLKLLMGSFLGSSS